MAKINRQHKACAGCDNHFTTYRNFDYCVNCAVNGSRYIPKKSKCPECGDGSGWVKFPNQRKRPCKLCVLTKKTMNKNKKLTAEEQERKYWNEVDQLAQEKIHQLLTTNIPFQNIPLINEPYRYEDAQQKKVGLFLRRDVDYRTLLSDVGNQYDELPEKEHLAEDITLWYLRAVMKSLVSNLKDYAVYENHYFEDLTEN